MTGGLALTAGDVMTRDVTTVLAESPVQAAIRKMLDRRVSGLPVLDGAGTVIGMLTEGDLLRRVELGTEEHRSGWRAFMLGPERQAADYVATHSRVVRDVMTPAVLSVDAAAPLAEVVSIMQGKRVKRVPVLAGHTLVGIVSRSDLLRRLAESFPGAAATGPSDAVIHDDILAEFRRQSWALEGIKVVVSGGVVDLEGIIFEASQRAAIRVAVENVPGVAAMRDHTTWVEPYSGMTDTP